MQLKIATSNFWGLPRPFSIHKKRRLRALQDIIEKEQFDILALQEFWLSWDIQKIRQQLPNFHFYPEHKWGFNPSGLVIISRHPLTQGKYIPFPIPLFHKEFPARKGLITSYITLPHRKIRIINTHILFSQEHTLSNKQNLQFATLYKHLSEEPTILVGDFNLPPELLPFPKKFIALSDTKQLTVDKQNPYATSLLNKVNSKSGTPDSIHANFPVQVLRQYTITKPLFSDHFPTAVELEI